MSGADAARIAYRLVIDAAVADGDWSAARAAALSYWADNRNASAARFLLARIDGLSPGGSVTAHRLAILRSFTVEPVVPLLQAEAAIDGVSIEPWVGEYNSYGQDILDPGSGLYAHRPDSVIVAVQARDVAPVLWSGFAGLDDDAVAREIEAVVVRLGDLIAKLRANSAASIIVHGLELPLHPNEGLATRGRAITQREAIVAINQGLRLRFEAMSDVVLLDYEALQARHGRERFISEKKWATAKLPFSVDALAWMAAEWWRHLAVLIRPRAKVLALDLDNTLWGGTIGEDGLAGIAIGSEAPGVYFRNLQRAVLDIVRRGVILVLVSKNNLADAMQVFDEHPEMLLRREHFAAMRVDWEPKEGNLRALAGELNLGLDSFVFLDDNPVERDAVRRALPEVIVPELGSDPSTYEAVLRSVGAFERFAISAEDADRTRYYADEAQRHELAASADNLEDFLASLDIRVAVAPIDAVSIARAAQLTQKTNQLNLTTRRYTESQLAEMLSVPRWRGYVLRSTDRFGDNGIVGVALTEALGEDCEIDTLLLSCRVIGRRIETAFISFLADEARRAGHRRLRGSFIPTRKNMPARDIYRMAGLAPLGAEDGAEHWGLDLATGIVAVPAWITMPFKN